MTRDEAIKRLVDKSEPYAHAALFVENCVALGMLKLDEPKGAEDRAIEVFEAAASDPHCGPRQLLIRLDACGLKIVKK